MDLDAILVWRPQIAVADELAHTNAPGSRHPKRYQDVLELLDAGIDVFTTVNVQHIESRRDTIQQITGVIVRETVPDSVLDLADEIVLIDLTRATSRPPRGRQRFTSATAPATAARNFSARSNLTALREMAMRMTSRNMSIATCATSCRRNGSPGPWKSGDRLLAAVRGGATSRKLNGYTRRLAASMEASWIVANVDTGQARSARNSKHS